MEIYGFDEITANNMVGNPKPTTPPPTPGTSPTITI